MRITHRRLTVSLTIIVTALAAATASAGSAAKCEEGPYRSGGKLWVQYCGPATATAKLAGKAPVKFASGHCIKRRGVMLLYLGKRPLRGTDPKMKYWEFVGTTGGDGVYRKDVFVEWWLGKRPTCSGTSQFVQEQAAAGDLHGKAAAGRQGKGLGLV